MFGSIRRIAEAEMCTFFAGDMLASRCFTRGLPVGFLLLRYLVLYTVESLSLLYLLFISLFICFWR